MFFFPGTSDQILKESEVPKCQKNVVSSFLCVFSEMVFCLWETKRKFNMTFVLQKTTFLGYQVGFFSSRPVIVRNKNQSSSTIVLVLLLMEVIRLTS